MTERSHQIEAAWLRLRAERQPGWYWLAHQQLGDIYNYCSLARAFRLWHATDLPMYMVVRAKVQAGVVSLFSEEFDEIIVAPELDAIAADWRDVFVRLQLPDFSPEAPLLCHPHVYPWFSGIMRGQREPWGYDWELFAAANRLSWMQIFKYVLRLPPDVEPRAPVRRLDAAAQAAALSEEAGIEPGHSVILFPYSQSILVDAVPHFEALAAELAARGYSIFTSVAGEERPVPGTHPISISFPILSDIAEIAGWVIVARSGVADILSGAQCRKTSISSEHHLREWGLDQMQLCRDAQQIVFDFGTMSPAALVHAVLSGESEAGAPAVRGLSDSLYDAGVEVASFSFVDLQQNKQSTVELQEQLRAHLRRKPFRARVRAARLKNIPARDHPRWGELIDRVVPEVFGGLHDGVRYYACRDNGRDDFLEELDLPLLRAGLYGAASYFHSLVAVDGGALDQLLPKAEARLVLGLEDGPLRRAGRLGYRDNPGRREIVRGARPWTVGDVQFIDGWFQAEHWGVWGRGRRSVLKLCCGTPPRNGFTMKLDCSLFLSPGHPRVEVQTRVNGGPPQVRLLEYKALPPGAIVTPVKLAIDMPAVELANSRAFWIEFRLSSAVSPARQFGTDDHRPLGLGLLGFEI